MDVLVNNFDTTLCAATPQNLPRTRSESAAMLIPPAIGLPIACWVALIVLWPIHSDAFAMTFLAVNALSAVLAGFCLSRAFVYGQRKLAAASALTLLGAVAPLAAVASVLRVVF